MAKVLTAARVRVPAPRETDYLATLRELCRFADARGQRIWVFRNAKDPQLFIEFSESATEMSHRAQASRLPEEITLFLEGPQRSQERPIFGTEIQELRDLSVRFEPVRSLSEYPIETPESQA